MRPNSEKIPSTSSEYALQKGLISAMRHKFFSILFRSTPQSANSLPGCRQKMLYNTHISAWHPIISQAAELYIVLSIIPSQ